MNEDVFGVPAGAKWLEPRGYSLGVANMLLQRKQTPKAVAMLPELQPKAGDVVVIAGDVLELFDEIFDVSEIQGVVCGWVMLP